MLIAFTALTAAATASAAPTPIIPSQEPAGLHPESSTFVIQVADVQGLMAAYPSTAMAKMLQDPDVHAKIGEVMGGADGPPVDPIAFAMQRYNGMVEGGEAPPLLDYLEELSSVSMSFDFAGGDPLAFIEGAESADDEALYASQNLGIRIVANFTSEEAAEQATAFMVEGLSSESGPGMEFRASAAQDFKVWSYAPSEAGSGAAGDAFENSARLAARGTQLSFFAGNVDPAEYMSVLTAGGMEGSALAKFAPGRAAFQGAAETPVVEMYIQPFMERLMMKEAPEFVPFLDVAEGLLGPAASMLIRGGHWRMGIDQGMFVTEGLHAPSMGGDMSGLIGAQPLDETGLSLSHPDALVTSVTSLDVNVLKKLVANMSAQAGPEEIAKMEAEGGFSLVDDLAGSLGNALAYSLPQLKSLIQAPNLMGAVRLEDRDGFIKGMDGLLRLAESLGDEVQLVRSDYRGTMVYTLSFTGGMFSLPMEGLPIDTANYFRPTIAVMGDRVLMTTQPGYSKKEIRRVEKASKQGEALGVHAQIAAMGELEGASTVGYADWPQFVGGLYSQMKALAPIIGGAAGLPFDMAALPDTELLVRHFRPSERWVKREEGGVLHYARSSLGLEMAGLPLGVAGFGTFGLMARNGPVALATIEDAELVVVDEEIEQPIIEDVEVSDHNEDAVSGELTATSNVLRDISVALTLYQLDHKGEAPETLAALLESSQSYPDGYLEGGAVPKDGWGRELIYTKTADGYELKSKGADPDSPDDDIDVQ